MDLGERLKAERMRLGFSQTDFAALVGASKHAQINWDKGVAAPNALHLAGWASQGLDVMYVVLGQRPDPSGGGKRTDEQELLDLYNNAPLAKKMEAVAILQGGTKGRGGISVKGSGNRTAGRDYHED